MKSRVRHGRLVLSLVGIILLAGCVTHRERGGPGVEPVVLPEAWSQETAGESSRSLGLLEGLGDKHLQDFLEEVLRESHGLRAGLAQLAQAGTQVRLQGAALLPQASVDLTHGFQESYFGSFGVIRTDVNSLMLSASWELDLWGTIRGRRDAAYARFEAAGFQYDDLVLSMVAAVSRTWFSGVEAGLQLALTERNLNDLTENLGVMEDRFGRGMVDGSDLSLFRGLVAAAEAERRERMATLDGLMRQLQVMGARYPDGSLKLPSGLPGVKEPVPAGLPSELLLRRPDLRAAEKRLLAQMKEREIAGRNWLPGLRLTGSTGKASSELGDLLDGSRLLSSLLASLYAPVFQGGRLEAERDYAEAAVEVEVRNFCQAVLEAMGEVEIALKREEILIGVESSLDEALRHSGNARDQVWELYLAGLRDITAVFDARRRAVEAESRLLAVRNQRLQNRIDLLVAIGGGFMSEDSLHAGVPHAVSID